MDFVEFDKAQAERSESGRLIGPFLLDPPDRPVLTIWGFYKTALYPAFQFTDDGKRRKDIEDVVEQVRSESPATYEQIACWLRTPCDSLDGMTPEAALAAGNNPAYGRVFLLADDFAWAARESLFM